MSTKFPSPLLGYNNNVRHKGRVFHIQTEDSGAKYGHIITHLFMDGGRILKSVKTSYTEYIGNERMAEVVREMMKQQHKAMFIALRDGKFDAVADVGSSPAVPAAASGEAPPGVSTQKAAAMAAAPAELMTKPPRPRADPKFRPGSGGAGDLPSAPQFAAEASADGTSKFASQSAIARDGEDAPPTERQGSRDDLNLDVGAIERAAAAAAAAPAPMMRDANDLPPPPANIFRERQTGRYRLVPETTSIAASAPPPVPEPSAGTPSPPRSMPSSSGHQAVKGGSERRYAPTRPASIFGQARPAQGKGIFGGDLISDKSLDEVILSYLAEDLDEKK
jgi:hypothetical protein